MNFISLFHYDKQLKSFEGLDSESLESLKNLVESNTGGLHVRLVGRKTPTTFCNLKKIEFEVKGLPTASSSILQPNEVCTIVT